LTIDDLDAFQRLTEALFRGVREKISLCDHLYAPGGGTSHESRCGLSKHHLGPHGAWRATR
jgi:hypothetical protein